MTAKIIVFTNQKGGCGKTTLTMNIGAYFKILGKKILIIDGDPQGTAQRWAAIADEKNPYPAPVMGMSNTINKAHQEIKKFIEDYEYIFVDCPPAVDNSFTSSVLLVANLAIVPVKPTPPDIWAAVGIKSVINSASEFNTSLNARLVMSMAQNNNITKDVTELLIDFGIEKFNSIIYQRTVFAQSALGSSVFSYFDTKAKMEVTKLANEIIDSV